MRLLVALAVMTHALWGCCMHHAHGASVAGRGACQQVGAAACADGGDHDHDHDHDRHGDCGSDRATGVLVSHDLHQGPPVAPAHEDCSEVKCLWLAAGEGSGVGDFRTSSAGLAAPAPSLVLSGVNGAHRVWHATRQGVRTPPVRAHLMHCVLLI